MTDFSEPRRNTLRMAKYNEPQKPLSVLAWLGQAVTLLAAVVAMIGYGLILSVADAI